MSDRFDSMGAYKKRFDAVLAYIETHLEGDLSVEALSGVANFSRFHFHRQFAAYVGVPVARYVQSRIQARVWRDAERISTTSELANMECDFCCPLSLRSFTMQVRIVDFSEVRVAALEHCGPTELVNESVRKFVEWRKQSGQSPVAASRTFGIPRNNPDMTPDVAFRFDICGEIAEPVASNLYGIHELVIPGGRCAVVRHGGSLDHISETIYPIYRDWLPTSGEELRDHPLFFHYLSVFPETPHDQWETDIYIPLL